MGGRPTVITKEIHAKLIEAFLGGHTDEEACLIAGIDTSTLYRYCQKFPSFASRKELFKQNITKIARINIVKKIQEGNVETSKWWMERKARDEFSTKDDLTAIIQEEKQKWENEQKMTDIHNYLVALADSKGNDPRLNKLRIKAFPEEVQTPKLNTCI